MSIIEIFNNMSGLEKVNTVLTILSGVCLIFSIVGAYKANKYYKKSKEVSLYTNTNVAYLEMKKILAILADIPRLNKVKRGNSSIYKKVEEYGKSIKDSIGIIIETLSFKDANEINNIKTSTNLDEYIDSFISGTIIVDEKFTMNDDFTKYQRVFNDIYLLLKEKLEKSRENIK